MRGPKTPCDRCGFVYYRNRIREREVNNRRILLCLECIDKWKPRRLTPMRGDMFTSTPTLPAPTLVVPFSGHTTTLFTATAALSSAAPLQCISTHRAPDFWTQSAASLTRIGSWATGYRPTQIVLTILLEQTPQSVEFPAFEIPGILPVVAIVVVRNSTGVILASAEVIYTAWDESISLVMDMTYPGTNGDIYDIVTNPGLYTPQVQYTCVQFIEAGDEIPITASSTVERTSDAYWDEVLINAAYTTNFPGYWFGTAAQLQFNTVGAWAVGYRPEVVRISVFGSYTSRRGGGVSVQVLSGSTVIGTALTYNWDNTGFSVYDYVFTITPNYALVPGGDITSIVVTAITSRYLEIGYIRFTTVVGELPPDTTRISYLEGRRTDAGDMVSVLISPPRALSASRTDAGDVVNAVLMGDRHIVMSRTDAGDVVNASVLTLPAASIAISHVSTPFVSAYPWSNATGFGTKFSNPATLPTGQGNDVAFSPSGTSIAVAHSTTPFVSTYAWSNTTGFGAKFSDPVALSASIGNKAAFSPSGTSIAIAHSATPFVSAYPWSNATGFGTKFSNPATLPASTGIGAAFSPSGTSIAISHSTTPFVSAYPWSDATGFGTKFSNPIPLPAGTGNKVAFSPSGASIAVAHNTTPFVSTYAWSNATGFGAKFSNPATLPAGFGNGVAFSPSGTAIAVVHFNTPFVSTYAWSDATGFGAKFSDPATLPVGGGSGVAFNQAGTAIAVVHPTTPFVSAYPWSNATGFGTKFSNPATLPANSSLAVAFNN
jgi:hypothetical protein